MSVSNGARIYITVQRRHPGKCVTMVTGISPSRSLVRILKSFKARFTCNGAVADDSLILQGNQSQNALNFLLAEGLATREILVVRNES